MTLISAVRQAGGIARTPDLWQLGFSPRSIAAVVKSGGLLRPRRGWVTVADVDRDLLFALQRGVVLTCVTQAKRLGIWLTEEPNGLHVAVRAKGDHAEQRGVQKVHWSRPIMMRGPASTVDSVADVLNYVAQCVPFEHALATWESALNKGLIDLDLLRRLHLSRAAREVLAACTPYSDSGLETLFKTRLRWLRLPIRPQVWLHGHRVDFLIGNRLVVQIDGQQHQWAQRDSDNRHDAVLMARGFHVIRVTYAQIMFEWPMVQELVLAAIATNSHAA